MFKSIENSQKKIDDLFDNFKKDINDDTTPLLSDIDESVFNFKTTEKNKIRKQLKKLADERKSVYIQDFDNYNNTITNEELKLINLIDKMNYSSLKDVYNFFDTVNDTIKQVYTYGKNSRYWNNVSSQWKSD